MYFCKTCRGGAELFSLVEMAKRGSFAADNARKAQDRARAAARGRNETEEKRERKGDAETVSEQDRVARHSCKSSVKCDGQ